ncbi:MAG TPA: DUF2231 domain-containing protein [Phycisphaerae bacterium]
MELWRFLGDWHPKLVQFPLVLLLAGLLFDLGGILFKSQRARWAGLTSTAAGTLGLLFAFICGIYAEIWAGRSGVPQHPIELHELAANIASWGFVVLFAWRILLAERDSAEGIGRGAGAAGAKWMKIYVTMGLLWYVLLATTAYLGGQLVFQYGAGTQIAMNGSPMLSLEDLNTLATRQTDENLRYSEWMHHIFGWMTLGLAMSLMAQVLRPASGRKLKWIVPAFLLAGGIFLFFMADLDLYKFTDLRQFRDREVQLHKVIAIIMGTIGCVGMWKWGREMRPARAGTVAREGSGGGAESSSKVDNSKLVAIMALIGGSLLFTHVHTVAPYANVAAGVYIAHVVLGLIALSIGAARLAQEHFPKSARQLGMVFAGLMLIESVLLVTYNEGLPWYIGYGRYDRWGADRFDSEEDKRLYTVAPFEKFRALMLVNQKAGRAYVSFRESMPAEAFKPSNIELTLDEAPQLLVTISPGQELSIPLQKTEADDHMGPSDPLKGSDFNGAADYLKTADYVSARLVVKVNGKRMVGYFDPWVTPLIAAVPPNEQAKYVCPMHESVQSEKPGVCPLCGMELVEKSPPRPAGVLHDEKYQMKLTGEKTTEAGEARLVMMFSDTAGKNVPLAAVHEQLIHLIIVSEDLSYFDHVHPAQMAGGLGGGGPLLSFGLTYKFPSAGRYLVFADVTPVGDREQVFRRRVVVDGTGVKVMEDEAGVAQGLSLDAANSKLAAEVTFPKTPQTSAAWSAGKTVGAGAPQIQLLSQPRTIYAGLHTLLAFHVSDHRGKPETDLAPYLGAMGHCVIISEDTTEYLHSHPEQIRSPTAETRDGPDVVFGATFPKAGIYRIWGQFHRGDELVYGVFTVEVKDSPVPAGLLRFLLNE